MEGFRTRPVPADTGQRRDAADIRDKPTENVALNSKLNE